MVPGQGQRSSLLCVTCVTPRAAQCRRQGLLQKGKGRQGHPPSPKHGTTFIACRLLFCAQEGKRGSEHALQCGRISGSYPMCSIRGAHEGKVQGLEVGSCCILCCANTAVQLCSSGVTQLPACVQGTQTAL